MRIGKRSIRIQGWSAMFVMWLFVRPLVLLNFIRCGEGRERERKGLRGRERHLSCCSFWAGREDLCDFLIFSRIKNELTKKNNTNK